MDERLVLAGFFRKAVEAVHPTGMMAQQVNRTGDRLTLADRRYDLTGLGRIRVVAIGKAAGPMMAEVESELSDRIDGGVVVVPRGARVRSDVCDVVEAGHPIPDEGSVRAAGMVMKAIAGLSKDDLVLVLLSGGASALLGDAGEIPLEELQALSQALLRSGADIHEMNTVRKHFSILKGGRLATLAHPAQVVTLVISDVIGDRLDMIGSGPTVADPTTWKDVAAIMDKYGIRAQAGAHVRQLLEAGCAGDIPDTPKPGDPKLGNSQSKIIGSNRIAMEAIAREAAWQKFHVVMDPEPLKGDARLAADIMAYRMATYKGPTPALFIRGGETTVTVKGSGRGGRNQEFVTAMMHAWQRMGLKPERMPTVLAAGTDGIDGPTDAAGGFADRTVWDKMTGAGSDPAAYLANNDAYSFLRATDGLFITGPTGTNVADLVLGILDPGF